MAQRARSRRNRDEGLRAPRLSTDSPCAVHLATSLRNASLGQVGQHFLAACVGAPRAAPRAARCSARTPPLSASTRCSIAAPWRRSCRAARAARASARRAGAGVREAARRPAQRRPAAASSDDLPSTAAALRAAARSPSARLERRQPAGLQRGGVAGRLARPAPRAPTARRRARRRCPALRAASRRWRSICAARRRRSRQRVPQRVDLVEHDEARRGCRGDECSRQIARSERVTPVSAARMKTTACADGSRPSVSSGSAPIAFSPGVSSDDQPLLQQRMRIVDQRVAPAPAPRPCRRPLEAGCPRGARRARSRVRAASSTG